MRTMAAAALMILFATTGKSETPAPVLALNSLDPIELAAGREVNGIETHESTFGRFRYRFTNEKNKQMFLGNPALHAIQFGGACGKMGPFSGTGNPGRFFVYDNRIYIFASEFCRDSFKKNPAIHIDKANPGISGSDEERRKGTILIEKVLKGFGGAKPVDAMKSLRKVEKITYREGKKETIGHGQATWVFPDCIRVEEDFGTPFGHVVKGQGGFELYGQKSWSLEPAMRDVAWRSALRHPLMMLHNRNSKGFVAMGRGENELEVSLDGSTSLWTLDLNTGHILKVEYTGRHGTVGKIVKYYSDFKPVNGVVIPHSCKEFFNDRELTTPERQVQSIVVNPELNAGQFLQSK